MRMWNVDPKLLCRQHLLGEHLELHMFAGCLHRGRSLSGYIDGGLVELHNLHSRHEALVNEMCRRGYTHKSPLRVPQKMVKRGSVDVQRNTQELARRCVQCRKRIKESR